MNRFATTTVVSFLMTLLLAVSATARIGYGVKGGLNFADLTGTDSEGFKNKTGMIAGVYAKLSFSPRVAIQPEILYTQKGSRGTEGGLLSMTFKMDYIEIPVLLRLTVPLEGQVEPFVYGGPSFAFITKAEIEFQAQGISATLNMANEKSSDIVFLFGGGLELDAGAVDVFFDLRYSLGLSNPYDDVAPFVFSDVLIEGKDFPVAWENGKALDVKQSAISVMAGIAF